MRQQPCSGLVSPTHRCIGVIQACHYDHGVHKDDELLVPGCAQFHTEWHDKGPEWMAQTYQVDFEKLAVGVHIKWMRYKCGTDFLELADERSS